MPPPSAPGAVTKYRASSEPRSLVLRKRLSASAFGCGGWTGCRGWRRPGGALPGAILLHQVKNIPALRARRADEVAGVRGRRVQEAGDVVGAGSAADRGPLALQGGRRLFRPRRWHCRPSHL